MYHYRPISWFNNYKYENQLVDQTLIVNSLGRSSQILLPKQTEVLHNHLLYNAIDNQRQRQSRQIYLKFSIILHIIVSAFPQNFIQHFHKNLSLSSVYFSRILIIFLLNTRLLQVLFEDSILLRRRVSNNFWYFCAKSFLNLPKYNE